MSRDAGLVAKRNAEIFAVYIRLSAEELPCSFKGKKVYVRLTYTQAIKAVGQLFHLSARTVESIITAAASTAAPLKTAPAT